MIQVKSLGAQAAQQRDAMANAQKAFRIAEDRYRSGLDTQIPMLTAESTLLQARSALAAVTAAAAQQRITLLLTLGGGFEYEPPAALAAAQTKTQIAKEIPHD
jgi:outer membrane protein TolC